MTIIREQMRFDELLPMAAAMFGNMVNAVVDVEREIVDVVARRIPR